MSSESVTRGELAAIQAAGKRALKAVAAAWRASGHPYLTIADVETASRWLAEGDRRAGVARPWPTLAGRLRNLARQFRAKRAS